MRTVVITIIIIIIIIIIIYLFILLLLLKCFFKVWKVEKYSTFGWLHCK